MAADLRASTYLVDGDDLQVEGVELAHDGAGLWAGLGETIGVDTFPGIDGGAISNGVYPPFTHSMLFTVSGVDAQAVSARIVALRRRCKPGRTVTLTRRMPSPEGVDANVDHTTTARRQGQPRVQWLDRNVKAQVDIDWLLVDVPWHGAVVNIADAAGDLDIDGDVPTHRMTITLAAGAARTVTNVTHDHKFTFAATVPTGGVLIDVEAQTATAITSGADMSGSLTNFPKRHLMVLHPGLNTLTVSAGTAAIAYQPAYE